MYTKIGIIGYGNMGSAIAEQIKLKYKIFVFDKDVNKTKDLSDIQVAKSNMDLLNQVDAVVLAVKPQDLDSILDEIKIYAKDKLIISIAAGITTTFIEKKLFGARVIRTMPNLPARVANGMVCLYKGRSATEQDLTFSKELFSVLGETLFLNDEGMMNVATAVSGSGPGFLCELVEGKSPEDIRYFTEHAFIPSLTAAAEKLGFSPEEAKILAETTGRGTVKYLEDQHLSPEEMKRQVASQKGTTEAGLQKLKHNIDNLTAAVKAALERANELFGN